MKTKLQFFALIPAAGLSQRMGRAKLSLPLGERTVLEWTLEAFRKAGVDTSLVVLGPNSAYLAPLAQSAGAEILVLQVQTPDMRSTVEAGLAWLQENRIPDVNTFWFLTPADHPSLDPRVIEELQLAGESNPDWSIFIPTYQGKRGHPALIHWKHVSAISQLAKNRGLNTYFRLHQGCTREIPVYSADILCDLDTPEDYEQLVKRWRQ